MDACPRDGKLLQGAGAAFPGAQRCVACGGLWLPSAVVRRRFGDVALTNPPPAPRFSALPCPDDRAPMTPHVHRGIEIDLCTRCGGVWLDREQYDRILGLQRAAPAPRGSPARGGPAQPRRDTSRSGDSVDVSIDVGEFVGDAVSGVFEFIGDVLSGL